MLRAAPRGSHPATPASTKPAPLRVPSPTARPPVVVRAAPSSLGLLSTASAGRNGAHWSHLLGARNTSTHACTLLGDALAPTHHPLPINALRRRFTTVVDTKAQKITEGERHFCSNGPINPDEQTRIYYVSPHEWNKKHLLDSVEDAAYVVLRGARQCGKTTRMKAFRTQLDAAGYITCFLDLQPVADAKSKIEMWKFISEGLQPAPEQRFADGADFEAWLKSLSRRSGKKDIVLIFDEGDALANLPDDLRTEFLSRLRSQKISRVMRRDEMSPVKAAYLIGVITASSLKTKKNVSPFNISKPLEAPFFTEAEVQQLFDQFAADQSKRDPAFVLDTAIVRHVFHLTNGHQGLVNMCGVRLNQLTLRLGRAPTADEWSNEMERRPLRDEFLGSTTGRRLLELLTEDPACNLVARYLLDPPASSLPVSLPSDVRFAAAEYMLVTGLLRRPDAATDAVEWASPIIASLASWALPRTGVPLLQELPVRSGCLEVAELIEHALPFMLRSLVCDPKAMKQKNKADRSKKAVQGVFESRYAAELRRVLTALLGGRGGAHVLSEEPPKPSSPRRLDIVVKYNTQPPIVIEVGANLNLTGQGEKDKSTLRHHIVKQAVPYLQQLGGKEAWVVNFTTVPPAKYKGGTYPFGQRAANVHVMHVFHDQQWTHAEIFASNGYYRALDLLERPTAAARPLLPPFELESFLRDEAKIDADGVKEYVPLLRKNKVNEAVLRALASKSEEVIKSELKEWGISAGGDRTVLVEAIAARFGHGKM